MPISTSGKGGATGVFGAISCWSIYLLFFLTPLFFLPWTTNILDLNKQMLLVVLAIIGLVAWLGQMVLSKRLVFRSGWLNVVPGLFLVAVLVSSLTSFAGYQTWVGQASQEYASFLSTAIFVLLFYMIMNNTGSADMQKNILTSLLASAALSGVVALLGMFDLVHLPFDFAASVGFNTVGTVNGLITFLTTVMFVGLAMWLVSQDGRDRIIPMGTHGIVMRALIVVVTVVNLVALIAVDFWVFWVINIIGVLLLGMFGFLQTHEFPNPKRFALPLVVLLVSVLLFFLPSPLKLNLPIVVSPSYKTSIDITKSALGTNSMQLLFGSGPGTFLHDYLAYKPVAVNASPFWSLSFDRAKSFVITMFATLGVVGSALWLLLMIWIAIKALGRLVFEKDHQEWKMTYVMFIGWAILFISHILYSSNFTMQFMLWGFTGLLASQVMSKIWKTDFSRSPKLGLTASFVFVVLSVAMLGSLFVTGQRYAAEVSFAKAIQLDSNGAPVERVIAELNQAVKLNGLSDVYYRNLASAQLSQVRQQIASYNGAELTPEQIQKVADLVSNAIKSGSRATEIEPNYVANWVVRGSIYRDLMSFAQGAEDLAAQMFLNAIRIEPINPVHRTNLGRVYVTVADRARVLKSAESAELAKTAAEQEAGLLQTAEQAFTTAIQLKPDYAPAHYYLAAVHERQGRLSDSVARLAALRNNNLTDIGLAFQLSQMLIRLQKFDLATQELERIVGLSPEYSNALWYLASMYEIQGRQGEAIQLVAKVVNKNPQNQVARTRLNRMQAGEITTVIPEPIQQGQGVPTMVPRGEVVRPVPAEEGVSEVLENPEEPTEGGADEVLENPEEVVEQNPKEPTE